MANVLRFGAWTIALRGEDVVMQIDARRLLRGQPGLFSPIRPNPECNWRLELNGQAESPCPPSVR